MGDEARQHLVFRVGQNWFALPAQVAAEVVLLPPPTHLPGAPEHIRGFFAHRGEVFPILDLAVLLGGSAGKPLRAVLVRRDGGGVAAIADEIGGMVFLSPPSGCLSSDEVGRCFHGPIAFEAEELWAIDVQALLAHLGQRAKPKIV